MTTASIGLETAPVQERYIRSHRVLNNLQVTAAAHPTVMFFPGVYTQSLEKGASLDLFGRLHDDKYYRAFNIYHCET